MIPRATSVFDAPSSVAQRQALADWWASQRWQSWVHPTFRHEVSLAVAEGALPRFVKRVARSHGQHLIWAAGIGRGRLGNAMHGHLLLRSERFDADHRRYVCANPAPAELLRRAWRQSSTSAGKIRVDGYDAGGGAAWYQADHAHFDVGVACPRFTCCRRSSGCRYVIDP